MSYEPLKTLYRGIVDVYSNLSSVFKSEETGYIGTFFKRPSVSLTNTFNAEFERLKINGRSLKEDPNIENIVENTKN